MINTTNHKQRSILAVGFALFAFLSQPIQSESVYLSYEGFNKKEIMKDLRSIDSIYSPPPVHFVGDGFRVHSLITPRGPIRSTRMNPFIMLDYNSPHFFSPASTPRGVDVHPHRGFETVTIAYQGEIAHRDNKGGGGIIGPGDVQWMTAASGVLHEEFHSESYSKEGGIFQMVQLWVNLPAKYKMSQPKYQPILKDSLINVSVGSKSLVELVAGSYGDAHGPAETFSPLHISNVHLSGEDIVPFSFPSEWNIGLLVLEGGLVVNEDQEVAKDHFAVLNHDAASFELRALEGDAKVLLLAGEPIKEPIVSYGPFVMNTEEEIRQAITDFQQGVFGDWP